MGSKPEEPTWKQVGFFLSEICNFLANKIDQKTFVIPIFPDFSRVTVQNNPQFPADKSWEKLRQSCTLKLTSIQDHGVYVTLRFFI